MSLVSYIEKFSYENNLTKKDFCKKAGVDVGTLRRLSNKKDVGFKTVEKIANAVGYDICFIKK